MDKIDKARGVLLARYEELSNKSDILKSAEIKQLFAVIPTLAPQERAKFGQAINKLVEDLKSKIAVDIVADQTLPPIDVTAPMGVNEPLPSLLNSYQGSRHPLMQEIETVSEIFSRMGFVAEESREIDDQYHMFESLNFPKGHPARDDYDTFMTVETDANGEAFIAPAHTSTMQNRVLKKYYKNLVASEPIAVIVPDRVFRNEDLDARHEHTFYQVEGVYVDKGVHAGMLVATLKKFLEEYYGRTLNVRVNPFYFPFTEPSFEFALECPFCKSGCNICSQSRWIELLGCGMIHPNVLRAADIDPTIYTGFAFGCGIDRLVMMKHSIEDIRHFESGKLDFLRQF